MAEVAKLIGVELDKPFRIKGSVCEYTLNEQGVLCDGLHGYYSALVGLITGKLVPEWTPKEMDSVFTLYSDGAVVKIKYRGRDKSCVIALKNKMIFRTEEEGIAKRDELGWVCE
jgi:hypothetical protein